jgi:hypothetical protein
MQRKENIMAGKGQEPLMQEVIDREAIRTLRALLSLRVAEGRGRLREPLYRRRLCLNRRSHPAGRTGTQGVSPNERFVRDLTARFIEELLSSGRADLVRDLAWDLPALVILRVLGIPDEDVARVKAGAESRLLLMWGY